MFTYLKCFFKNAWKALELKTRLMIICCSFSTTCSTILMYNFGDTLSKSNSDFTAGIVVSVMLGMLVGAISAEVFTHIYNTYLADVLDDTRKEVLSKKTQKALKEPDVLRSIRDDHARIKKELENV